MKWLDGVVSYSLATIEPWARIEPMSVTRPVACAKSWPPEANEISFRARERKERERERENQNENEASVVVSHLCPGRASHWADKDCPRAHFAKLFR